MSVNINIDINPMDFFNFKKIVKELENYMLTKEFIEIKTKKNKGIILDMGVLGNLYVMSNDNFRY